MKPCDIRPDFHIPNHTSMVYDIDQSGTVPYRWNASGFRGEDYNPDAQFKICIVGESNAVGVGIKLEDTFGYRLKEHIAHCRGCHTDDVNLVNFAAAGASADYCVRMLYTQLADCAPDLVICQFPEPARAEYHDGSQYRPINVFAVRRAQLANAPLPLLAYCDYYTEPVGMTNLIKNVLLAQALLRKRRISYIIATQFLPQDSSGHGYLDDYFRAVDTSAVLWHQYFIKFLDRAADGRHAGPRSHDCFAVDVLDRIGQLQPRKGETSLGRKLQARAAQLKAANADWRFWNPPAESTSSGQGQA